MPDESLSTSSLPPVNREKFYNLEGWGQTAFSALEGQKLLKPGRADQQIIQPAVEEFSGDVAYSGLVAAYDRFQSPAYLQGDGPQATKFDVLTHYYDTSRELLTNKDALHQVQKVIINLCGGPERYKFLYKQGAGDYQVADIVKAVVDSWVKSQSQQSKLKQTQSLLASQRRLNQRLAKELDDAKTARPEQQAEKPAEAAAEIPAVAQEFYVHQLTENGKKQVDTLAKLLVANDVNPAGVLQLAGSLPELKAAWDFSGGKKGKQVIKQTDLRLAGQPATEIGSLVEILDSLLALKQAPKLGESAKFAANQQYFKQLSQVLPHRVDWARHELAEAAALANKQGEFLESLNDWQLELVKPGQIKSKQQQADIDNLREKAQTVGITLPPREFTADAGVVNKQLDSVNVDLADGWQVGKSTIKLKEEFVPNPAKEILQSMNVMLNMELRKFPDGYSWSVGQGGSYLISAGEDKRLLATVKGEGHQFKLVWADGLAVVDGLDATRVMGQAFADFIQADWQFPGLRLDPVATSGTLPEVEPPLPAPEAEAKAEEAEAGDDDVPDWLKALTREEAEESKPSMTELASEVNLASETLSLAALFKRDVVAAEYGVFQWVSAGVKKVDGEFQFADKPEYGSYANGFRGRRGKGPIQLHVESTIGSAEDKIESRAMELNRMNYKNGVLDEEFSEKGQIAPSLVLVEDAGESFTRVIIYGGISAEVAGSWKHGRTNNDNYIAFKFAGNAAVDKFLSEIDAIARVRDEGTKKNYLTIREALQAVFPQETMKYVDSHMYRWQEIQEVVDLRGVKKEAGKREVGLTLEAQTTAIEPDIKSLAGQVVKKNFEGKLAQGSMINGATIKLPDGFYNHGPDEIQLNDFENTVGSLQGNIYDSQDRTPELLASQIVSISPSGSASDNQVMTIFFFQDRKQADSRGVFTPAHASFELPKEAMAELVETIKNNPDALETFFRDCFKDLDAKGEGMPGARRAKTTGFYILTPEMEEKIIEAKTKYDPNEVFADLQRYDFRNGPYGSGDAFQPR